MTPTDALKSYIGQGVRVALKDGGSVLGRFIAFEESHGTLVVADVTEYFPSGAKRCSASGRIIRGDTVLAVGVV